MLSYASDAEMFGQTPTYTPLRNPWDQRRLCPLGVLLLLNFLSNVDSSLASAKELEHWDVGPRPHLDVPSFRVEPDGGGDSNMELVTSSEVQQVRLVDQTWVLKTRDFDIRACSITRELDDAMCNVR
mmetsp:Transcript_23855/g.35711  ORF Transcript_23855/g.35711 Transcript_23855/m.35711 type:complete len:127 (-) Transcript_23855:78-458(-)